METSSCTLASTFRTVSSTCSRKGEDDSGDGSGVGAACRVESPCLLPRVVMDPRHDRLSLLLLLCTDLVVEVDLHNRLIDHSSLVFMVRSYARQIDSAVAKQTGLCCVGRFLTVNPHGRTVVVRACVVH